MCAIQHAHQINTIKQEGTDNEQHMSEKKTKNEKRKENRNPPKDDTHTCTQTAKQMNETEERVKKLNKRKKWYVCIF